MYKTLRGSREANDKKRDGVREAAKKVLFLVVRPLRPVLFSLVVGPLTPPRLSGLTTKKTTFYLRLPLLYTLNTDVLSGEVLYIFSKPYPMYLGWKEYRRGKYLVYVWIKRNRAKCVCMDGRLEEGMIL